MITNVLLFAGNDASGHVGLWVTDGRASRTYELTGIAGAAANGVQPFDLTIYKGEALFSA